MDLKETIREATPRWVKEITQTNTAAPIEASVKDNLWGSDDEAYWSIKWEPQDLLDPSLSVWDVIL